MEIFFVTEEVILFSSLRYIYQMVRHFCILRKVFAGTYIHIAVNLTGICGDNLTSAVWKQTLSAAVSYLSCRIYGKGGLSACGGPHYGKHITPAPIYVKESFHP